MCKKEFSKTVLAKQKHAEFMLKLADKIYGIVLTGVLGAPVLHWFTNKEMQADGTFMYYTIILVVGVLAAICLQLNAMTIYNHLVVEPNKSSSEDSAK